LPVDAVGGSAARAASISSVGCLEKAAELLNGFLVGIRPCQLPSCRMLRISG